MRSEKCAIVPPVRWNPIVVAWYGYLISYPWIHVLCFVSSEIIFVCSYYVCPYILSLFKKICFPAFKMPHLLRHLRQFKINFLNVASRTFFKLICETDECIKINMRTVQILILVLRNWSNKKIGNSEFCFENQQSCPNIFKIINSRPKPMIDATKV